MAGNGKRIVTPDELKQAAQALAEKQGLILSTGEGGSLTLMPGDILITLEDGRPLVSGTDSAEIYMRLMEILMEMAEAPVSPRIEDRANGKGNPPKQEKPVKGQMVQSLVHMRDMQVAELTFDDIKTYICEDATDQEAMIFLKLCQARNLNPFLRDAYLIKYDKTKPAQMVVGKDAFTKKAEDHPKFSGYKAGIIIQNGKDEVEHREGTFIMKGETLLGGWAEVYRSDRVATPYKMSVPMNEYSTGKSNWVTKPATMIRKVALVQALREAFPSELSGMYDNSEIGIDPDKEVAGAQ
jgi:phage recombination protein Bet